MHKAESIFYFIQGLFIIGIMIWLYFLPSILAFRRHTQGRGWILFWNLILGWTLIVWCVMLVAVLVSPGWR
jgi:Superinfection immunity protein